MNEHLATLTQYAGAVATMFGVLVFILRKFTHWLDRMFAQERDTNKAMLTYMQLQMEQMRIAYEKLIKEMEVRLEEKDRRIEREIRLHEDAKSRLGATLQESVSAYNGLSIAIGGVIESVKSLTSEIRRYHEK